jgi:hypothetical protein
MCSATCCASQGTRLAEREIYLIVQRARIVLLAHEGHGTEEIARAVG